MGIGERMRALDWQPQWSWRLSCEMDTIDWGTRLAHARACGLFCLQGDLGCGKTTLVRGVLRGLGYTGMVPSPSYTLLEHYEVPHDKSYDKSHDKSHDKSYDKSHDKSHDKNKATHNVVFHFDLYRIADAGELEGIGFRDYLANVPPALCFLEWPEHAGDYLSLPDVWLRFQMNGTERMLSAAAGSRLGRDVLSRMCEHSVSSS